MRAAFLTDIERIEVGSRKVVSIHNPRDVLIRVKTVGICGSDIHYYKSGKIGGQHVQFPFIVGHEAGGEVVDTGAEVTHVQPGDKIAIEPSVACHQCEQCRMGRIHTCLNNLFLGCPGQLDGALQEYLVMPEKNCIKLPDTLNFEHGAISEPLAIGVYAWKRSGAEPSHQVGILGYGPIGASVHYAGLYNGVENFFVADPINDRIKIAVQNGAEAGKDAKSYENLDVVFECCGDQSAMLDAIEMLRPGGKLVIIGIPDMDKIVFNIHDLRRKEIDIINIRRQVGCVEEALTILASGQVDYSRFVSHRFELNDTALAFDIVANYRDGVMKAMINL